MFSINVTFNYTVKCYCDVLCYTIKIIKCKQVILIHSRIYYIQRKHKILGNYS